MYSHLIRAIVSCHPGLSFERLGATAYQTMHGKTVWNSYDCTHTFRFYWQKLLHFSGLIGEQNCWRESRRKEMQINLINDFLWSLGFLARGDYYFNLLRESRPHSISRARMYVMWIILVQLLEYFFFFVFFLDINEIRIAPKRLRYYKMGLLQFINSNRPLQLSVHPSWALPLFPLQSMQREDPGSVPRCIFPDCWSITNRRRRPAVSYTFTIFDWESKRQSSAARGIQSVQADSIYGAQALIPKDSSQRVNKSIGSS